MDFVTPNQLKLHEQEPDGYVSVCSKLLHLAAHEELVEAEFSALENTMVRFEYWKSLGFEDMVAKEDVLEGLEQIKQTKKAKERRPSEAKRLLIEIFLNRQLQISNEFLMILYNGVIYPKVKNINSKRVKKMQK
jgi:hypothetical protein